MDFNQPKYIKWIINENGICFEDGVPLKCYRVSYDLKDDEVLNDWAIHIRRHYRTDKDLTDAVRALNISECEYLKTYVIPQKEHILGPQTISAEIAEILLYDLFEYVLNYTALRGRHWNKPTPTSPIQGSDVMVVKISKDGKPSKNDELCIIEVKAKLAAETPKTKNGNYEALVTARNDSDKDSLRYAMSLDFMRFKYKDKGETIFMQIVERFQQKVKYPYIQKFIAAGVISRDNIENSIIVGIKGADLKITVSNEIFLIHGDKLMDLAYEIYRRIIV